MTPCSASFLISWGLMIAYRVNGKDCDTDELGTAMLSCEQERETLSAASRHNDTTKLCQALQQYSECIGPKISNCNEEAMAAFNIIKQQYAGTPYHCQITDSLNQETQFQNDVSRHHNVDDENHIITNGPTNGLDKVTVATLPDNKTPEKRKDIPAEMKATTSASMVDPPGQDDNLPPNTAHSTHSPPTLSVFVITTAAFIIASFITPFMP